MDEKRENTKNEDECIVVIPDSFDDVADCITRSDLKASHDSIGAPPEGMNTSSHRDNWHKHAFSEGLNGFGLFKEYEDELKCGDNEGNEKLHRAFSKIEQLDRLIRKKEIAHREQTIRSQEHLDIIREDVVKCCCLYEQTHGVPPPGCCVDAPAINLVDSSEAES
eukprot:11692976-Ditylum_brightwellii.AAC.1